MAYPLLQRHFPWLLLFGILLNVPGLWLDVMEPDSALYATIAKRIAEHNDWSNLFVDGHEWLDKPHFPFWMAAISYKIFGVTGFAYKLPSFIFWLAGLWYTYVTARDLFNVSVAQLSVLIYAVALHSSLGNFDVRAEPYLTTCIIAAIWHMLNVYHRKHWIHIVAAAFFTAAAIMTKGIFVLITIGGGWVIFWAIAGEWKQFLNYRWYLFLVLSFIFILPELYSLYVQFDMHPEKIVFGRTHVSGLKFFFWDSQFGRFFNTGPIKGRGSLLFFVHTTLWAFLPWSIGLMAGIVYLIRYDKKREPVRWVIYGSALVTFLLFSLSKFQLPHYIVIVFPYFSIITAYFLYEQANRGGLRYFSLAQTVILLLTGALALWLLYFTGIKQGIVSTVEIIVILILGVFGRTPDQLQQLVFRGYATAAVMYVFLFFNFYPFLLQYQSGRQAARILEGKNLPAATYKTPYAHAFEFYAPGDVNVIGNIDSLSRFLGTRPCVLYTTPAVNDSLTKAGMQTSIVARPDHFHITRLKREFLSPKTRSETVEQRYLLYIK